MKKIISVLLILVITFLPVMVSATPFDYFGKQVNVNTIGVKPAEFKNVEYKIKNDVIRLNSEKLLPLIKSEEQIREGITETELTPGEIISNIGYIKANHLNTITQEYKIGTVLVDEKSQTAVKINSLSDSYEDNEEFNGYLAVERPEVYEILDHFKIPKQTVKLNEANIAAYGNGMEECLVSRNRTKTYAMASDTVSDFYSGSALDDLEAKHLNDPMVEFKFDNESFTAYTKSGGEVNVKLSGYLGIDSISVGGDYSGFDGYEFYLKTGEEMYLKAVITSDINEEVVIPVIGIDVNAKVARVYGGLFLVIGLNGQFTLVTEARQWLMIEKAGIRGGTFCYVPTGFKPLFKLGDKGFDVDASFNGAINGYIKAGPMLGLEIFGFETAGAGALFGGGAKCEVLSNYIEADIYGIANIYATLLGRRKNLLNWNPVLFHKRQLDMEGYIVSFKEACAYRKIVWGKIEMDEGEKGTKPYIGCFDLVIKDSNGSEKRRYEDLSTDEFGDFCKRNIDVVLNRDDIIAVEVESRFTEGKIITSNPISPTYPFKTLRIDEADYFNDYVKGHVPTAVVKDWSKNKNIEINYEGDIIVFINNGSGEVLQRKIKTDEYGDFVLNSSILPKSTVFARIDDAKFVIDSNTDIKPTVDIIAKRIVIPTEISNYMQNDVRVDGRKENEKVIVYNLRGLKAVKGEAEYIANYKKYLPGSYIFDPNTGLPLPPMHVGQKQGKIVLYNEEWENTNNKLVPISMISSANEGGGASYAVNDFNTEWVWGTKESTFIKIRDISDKDTVEIPVDTKEPIEIRNPIITRDPIIIKEPVLTRDPIIIKEPDTIEDTPLIISPIITPAPLEQDKEADIPSVEETISDISIEKIPNSFNIVFQDKNKPQNTIDFRYYSGIDYTELESDNLAFTSTDVGYLKRKGELEYKYEGETIIIKDPNDTDKVGKGKKVLNQPAGAISLDKYLARMLWSVISPMPDEMTEMDQISNISALPTWSRDSAKRAVDMGMMDLGEGGIFKSGNVTRGECAAYIAQAYGLEGKLGNSKFSDVTYMNPYLPQINAAVDAGLISGYSDTRFGTFESVTREQMAAIIMRGFNTKYGSKLSIGNKGIKFNDMKNISSWAANSVNEVSALGIMKGNTDGSFN
ncbi:MAG: S-layer homology domain-containing protein, partial [Clostridiaceae bacterium]|nr:S-layer homology domain-containing protein [Clostridiaceae bacterium]